MECELAQHKIALFAYGELADDECHGLEGHLGSCQRCQEELLAVQALQQAMSLAPAQEPSANLLARARLQLEEALDSMPRSGWINRLQQSMFRGVSVLGRAPITASALLMLGLAGGGWAGYRSALHKNPQTAVAVTEPSSIAKITSITRQPHSENVEVHFTTSVPRVVHGSLDDPQIRTLLLVATHDGMDPAITKNSVGLLSEECLAGHDCSDGPVREALMVSLCYDKSSAVRMEALNGLKPYVSEDVRVRDAVLEALMNDEDPAVRSRAIETLRPVEADSQRARGVIYGFDRGRQSSYSNRFA